MIAFDVYVHNADRRFDNANLFVARDQFLAFDHEQAFAFLYAIGGSDPVDDECADILGRHVLRPLLRGGMPSLDDLLARVERLDDGFFEAVRVDGGRCSWQDRSGDRRPPTAKGRGAALGAARGSVGGPVTNDMKRPCQAVIIRVAPDPASGEVLNVGVVLHAPEHRYLGARFTSTWKRVTDAFPDADRVHLGRIASSIRHACESAYPGAQLDLASPPDAIVAAVRAIVPEDDASLLLSRPLSGLTADPERTLGELFERYVVRGEPAERRQSRADADVWRGIAPVLAERGVLARLHQHVLRGRHHYEERFDYAWKNGRWHVARPLSLDLVDGQDIVRKAAEWTGRVRVLDPIAQHTTVILVVGLPGGGASGGAKRAAQDGLGLLREQLADEEIAEVLVEGDAPRLADRIASDLAHAAAEAE